MVKKELKTRIVGILLASAAQETAASKLRLIDAKLGAVRAYAAFASIPIIGPILGAAAAAAAFAFLMAFQRGGLVPGVGTGGRDTVPAILEPSEFVIQRGAVQAIGPETLDFINRTGTLPPAGAGLGAVGDVNLQLVVEGGIGTIGEMEEYLEDEVVPRLRDINERGRGLSGRRSAG